MKRLKEIGHVKTGMTLIDRNGNKGTITSIGNMEGIDIIHFDDNPNFIMLDWDRLRNDVYVEETE